METIFQLRHDLSSIGGKNYLRLNEGQLKKEIERILCDFVISFQKNPEAYYLLSQRQRIGIFFYKKDLEPTENCLILFKNFLQKDFQKKDEVSNKDDIPEKVFTFIKEGKSKSFVKKELHLSQYTLTKILKNYEKKS